MKPFISNSKFTFRERILIYVFSATMLCLIDGVRGKGNLHDSIVSILSVAVIVAAALFVEHKGWVDRWIKK